MFSDCRLLLSRTHGVNATYRPGMENLEPCCCEKGPMPRSFGCCCSFSCGCFRFCCFCCVACCCKVSLGDSCCSRCVFSGGFWLWPSFRCNAWRPDRYALATVVLLPVIGLALRRCWILSESCMLAFKESSFCSNTSFSVEVWHWHWDLSDSHSWPMSLQQSLKF